MGWGILESNTPVIMYDKNTYTGYWAGDDEKISKIYSMTAVHTNW